MSSVITSVAFPGGGVASSVLNNLAEKGHNAKRRSTGLSLCGNSTSAVFAIHNKDDQILRTTSSSSSREQVQETVLKLARERMMMRKSSGQHKTTSMNNINSKWDLDEAYNRCLDLAITDGCSVAFGTSSNHLLKFGASSMMTLVRKMLNQEDEDKIKAFAAVAVWCRRMDNLVDGINGCCATPEDLDRWEQRLNDLYEGRPHDLFDAALSHTLSKYPVDLQLFKDMVQGMRMDISKTRYESFDQLYLYMYHVAATVSIMLAQILGTSPQSKAPLENLYNGLLSFSIAAQLTDILRDIVEDAAMGRIYLPQDELARAGLSEEDIYRGRFMSNEWRNYMKEQIKRVRAYANEGEEFINEMNFLGRLAFWIFSLSNRQMLDPIEAQDYNLTNPVPVKIPKIIAAFLMGAGRSIMGSFSLPWMRK